MSITLDVVCHDEAIEAITHMLLVGLSAYGEVLRVENAVRMERACGREVSTDLIPLDPTGDAGTVSDFADAIRSAESIRLWLKEKASVASAG